MQWISVRFTGGPLQLQLKRRRDSSNWKEAVEPPKLFWQEASWENYSAADTCYLSWKKKDDSKARATENPTTALRPNQGTPNIYLPSEISESLWTSDSFVCPLSSQLPFGEDTPFGDYKRFQSNRNQKRAGEKGALILCHFRPVSPECISIAKSSLLWLLSANLLVTRVFVRKLKQSGGNFPPPHFTHLVPSVSVNFPSLPLLYTKQLPSL